MTRSRDIIPGATYLIERDFSDFFSIPSPFADMVDMMFYCLAVSSKTYTVEINAFSFQQRRWQAVVTPHGDELSPFLAWFHQHLSKCIRAMSESCGAVWSKRRARVKLMLIEREILDGIACVLSTPALAGVDDAGVLRVLRSSLADYGASPTRCQRPVCHFRESGSAPAHALLSIVPPPGPLYATPEQYATRLGAYIGGDPSIVDLVPMSARVLLAVGTTIHQSTDRASMPKEKSHARLLMVDRSSQTNAVIHPWSRVN
jgi:hypothetical protein